jgi:hypothetical protein
MALKTDIRGMHHDGQIVMEAYTTLMGQQGENSAKIDFL